MDEGRKRVIGIMAAILAGLHMRTADGGKRSDVYAFIGQKLYFENCLFLFVINSAPPNEGQSLTQQLLAQSGDRFTVTAPTLSTHS